VGSSVFIKTTTLLTGSKNMNNGICTTLRLGVIQFVAALILSMAAGTAYAAASVLSAEFCVDANNLRFMVDIEEPDNPAPITEIRFGIGADVDPFNEDDIGDETERIAYNFDRNTGLAASVFPFGPAALSDDVNLAPDRWTDGPISDFTVTPLGGLGSGLFLIEGSVLHGSARFNEGDTIAGVAFILGLGAGGTPSGGPPALRDIPVTACNNQVSDSATLGTGVILGVGVVIEDHAIIGNNVVLSNQVFVGRNTIIGADTVLETGAQVARDVIIGERVTGTSVINTVFHPVIFDKGARVGDDSYLEGGTEVGAGAVLGSRVITRSFIDHADTNSVVLIEKNATVGNDVFLDHGTFVGRGVVLGDNVSATTLINGIFSPVLFYKGASAGADSVFDGATVVEMKASVGTDTMVGNHVTIGKNAEVGNNVTLADGVIVEKGTVVPDGTTLP